MILLSDDLALPRFRALAHEILTKFGLGNRIFDLEALLAPNQQ